jgi:hypothetical protein
MLLAVCIPSNKRCLFPQTFDEFCPLRDFCLLGCIYSPAAYHTMPATRGARMPQYTPVDVNSNKDELDAFLERAASPEDILQRASIRRHRVSGSLQTTIPWALAVIFGTLSLFLIWERDAGDGYRYGTYEEGFDTDIGESLALSFLHEVMYLAETDGFVKLPLGRSRS